MSDTLRLLQASIDLIEKDQEIEALRAENKLLAARLQAVETGIARLRIPRNSSLPALLRRQAG